MNEIECPYCEHSYDLCHDDGAFYDEGRREEEECPNCEKKFMVSSYHHWSFEAEKADCLNSGKHNFKQMTGSPKEYFIGRFRCTDCDEEEHRDEEGRLKALKELYN